MSANDDKPDSWKKVDSLLRSDPTHRFQSRFTTRRPSNQSLKKRTKFGNNDST